MKRFLTGAAVIAVMSMMIGLFVWFGLSADDERMPTDRLLVITTIYPLAAFVQAIGGDFVFVNNVVPAGAEPHDYEPTPRQIADLVAADALIYLGELDAWAADLAPEVILNGGKVLGVAEQVPLAKVDWGTDPHIWLDPVAAQDIVTVIRDVLIQADPMHSLQYQLNAEAYIQLLMELDESYRVSLSVCKLNDIIVSHDAFGYLARRYDFTVHSIRGVSPDAEPSVRDLADLTAQARQLGVTTIFFETLVSPELSETLAAEVGATTAVLNPLEGLSSAELAAGETYLSIMEKNRMALSLAMLCQ